MKSSVRLALACVAFAALGVIPGCINFEHQTLTYHHDTARDTLLIHQNYVGIHGTEDAVPPGQTAAGLPPAERTELQSVWQTDRTFFFSNWIFELNLPGIRQQLEAAPPSATDAGADAADKAFRNLSALLIAHTRISNGPFYLGADGRLSGVQRVTVGNVTALVAAGNSALRALLDAEAESAGIDAAKRSRYKRFAADPAPLIVLKGNRITVRFPTSREEFDRALRGSDGAPDPTIAAFQSAGGTVAFADEMVTVAYGRTDSSRESVALPVAPGSYNASAVAYVREHFGIAEKFDPAADVENFFTPPPSAAK